MIFMISQGFTLGCDSCSLTVASILSIFVLVLSFYFIIFIPATLSQAFLLDSVLVVNVFYRLEGNINWGFIFYRNGSTEVVGYFEWDNTWSLDLLRKELGSIELAYIEFFMEGWCSHHVFCTRSLFYGIKFYILMESPPT